ALPHSTELAGCPRAQDTDSRRVTLNAAARADLPNDHANSDAHASDARLAINDERVLCNPLQVRHDPTPSREGGDSVLLRDPVPMQLDEDGGVGGEVSGGPCRDRTYDQEIKSLLLYQLS